MRDFSINPCLSAGNQSPLHKQQGVKPPTTSVMGRRKRVWRYRLTHGTVTPGTEEPAAPGLFPLGSEQMRILPHPDLLIISSYSSCRQQRVGNSKAALGPTKLHRLGQLLQPTLPCFTNRGSPRVGITPDFLRKKEQQHFGTEEELVKCPGS